jgi:dipeptidyl aminopeptidase/acylaminoacyl peptidase
MLSCMNTVAIKRGFRSIVLFLLTIYIAAAIYLYISQRDVLFNPLPDYQTPAELGLDDFTQIPLVTADSVTIHGWWHPPKLNAPTIVFFHGNGSTLVHYTTFLKLLAKHFGVLAVEYRGFAGLPGDPSETGVYEDARAAIRYLQEQQGIDSKHLILTGQSLGTGVATQMATEYDTHALVLISPYTAIVDIAAERYWFFPVRPLLTERFDTLTKIAKVDEPILIFHGTTDKTVPYAMSERLVQHNPATIQLFTLKDQGHDVDHHFIAEAMAQRLKLP